MAETITNGKNGKNGSERAILAEDEREQKERRQQVRFEEQNAKTLAERYRLDFIELKDFQIDHSLFRSIPVDLMFRYNFVPFKKENDILYVVVADPSNILMVDDLELQLGIRIRMLVGTQSAIQDVLKK